nr:DUF4183 domain-containing protein [Metabacillus idriensis]
MALKIIKLALTAETKVSAQPAITRYFYETTKKTTGLSTLKIDASSFLDDAGRVVKSLPVLKMNNSYFNVYINGVLQMEDKYTSGEKGFGNLIITLPEGSEIAAHTPIILEVLNFNPVSKTTLDM